ncbi:MAG: hypothetical protein ACFB14_26460 [Leptolyngbyaceae cyanobacterium]
MIRAVPQRRTAELGCGYFDSSRIGKSKRTAAYIQALNSLGAAMDARGTRADYVGKK